MLAAAFSSTALRSRHSAFGQTMPLGVRLGGLLPMSVQEGGADIRALIFYSRNPPIADFGPVSPAVRPLYRRGAAAALFPLSR